MARRVTSPGSETASRPGSLPAPTRTTHSKSSSTFAAGEYDEAQQGAVPSGALGSGDVARLVGDRIEGGLEGEMAGGGGVRFLGQQGHGLRPGRARATP